MSTPQRFLRPALAGLATTLLLAGCAPGSGPTSGPSGAPATHTPATATSAATSTAPTASFSLTQASGGVSLGGVAPDEATKQAAASAVAKALGGGVPVTDKLGVVSGSWLPAAEDLGRLASALAGVEAVSLNVNQADAVLGGTVTTEAEKSAAGDAVKTAFPAMSVQNNLAVVPLCSVKGAKVREVSKPPALVFQTGSAQLSTAAQSAVTGIAKIVAACPDTQLTVVGQTDARGGESSNEALARQRAQAVADALVAAGVPKAQVLVQGNAANAPVSSDNALNRRVDIAVR